MGAFLSGLRRTGKEEAAKRERERLLMSTSAGCTINGTTDFKVRQNARQHFAAAKLLANSKDYGNGIAHLILGAEELVKSAILLLQGLDFPVRDIKNMINFFIIMFPGTIC